MGIVTQELTTQAVDYLQRTGDRAPPDARGPSTMAPEGLRRMWRIAGVGRLEKEAIPRPGEDAQARLITEDLLVGLYGRRIPVAFEIAIDPGGPKVALGTWLPEGGDERDLDRNAGVLKSLLASLYPTIELAETEPSTRAWSHSGLGLGIPSAKPPELLDGSLPVDRLLRALSGDTWAALVLADVVPAATTQDLRMRILNEMRAVAEAPSGIGRGPLAEHYTELLKRGLTNLTEAQGTGAWRTAVYLAGDVESYDRLAGVWRGVYSGPASSPEPIRVLDTPAVTELVQEWALPDEGDDDPPGLFRHPFTHQTLLTSAQLAAYIHLPRLETRGFAIRLVPDFDAVPAPVVGDRLRLGRIVERDQASEVEFVVGRDQLTRHAFVTGVTGSGKTNTIFQLVTQAAAADIPFLVIEPTKTEYRSLLETDVMGEALSVFTLGNELVAPFRLNPFEFPAGIPVGVHLDLLRSVFNVSS